MDRCRGFFRDNGFVQLVGAGELVILMTGLFYLNPFSQFYTTWHLYKSHKCQGISRTTLFSRLISGGIGTPGTKNMCPVWINHDRSKHEQTQGRKVQPNDFTPSTL
jgi:hypothetical protein